MLATLWSAAVRGVDGFLVRVETDLSNGLPCFTTVGLPDGTVREARERVVTAVRNAGFSFPDRRVVVNLAPAERRKEGSHLDLPIALGVLAASGQIEARPWAGACCAFGELALDGSLRPVRGALALALAARERGMRAAVVPQANAAEAALAGMPAYGARTLEEAARLVERDAAPAGAAPPPENPAGGESGACRDLADVRGQVFARRALEIAAAGGHHLLMSGPPGSGKSMLARRLPGILPPLTSEEALEVSRIQSVAGLRGASGGLARWRPFRAPHSSASTASMIGGGPACRPGEIVLAHRGVLFLDELPEFARSSLEALRQPLEDRTVLVTRVRDAVRYPADFSLVAAMNPCPCGNEGLRETACVCSEGAVRRYRARVSGPLRDRMDLRIQLAPLPFGDWSSAASGEPSSTVRERVVEARRVSARRYAPGRTNASLSTSEIRVHCAPDGRGMVLLERFAGGGRVSARGIDRVLRVARTIADLAGSERIVEEHLAEALAFRGAAEGGSQST
jgi:magnesium chelatase family protein